MKTIRELFNAHCDQLVAQIGAARNVEKQALAIDPILPSLKERFPTLRPIVIGPQVILSIEVSAMADVLPLLEEIERAAGCVFDTTEDRAESGWREFSCSGTPWVRVDAEVGSGTDKCRRVVVGTEEVLKYAFECDEVAL